MRQSYRDDAEAPAGLLFPVLGSRAGGVSTRSGSSIPTKAASLDLQELDRHQRSANGKPFFSPGLGDYGERLRGPTGAAALDLQELERHQRSASGTADPGVGFYGTRLGGPMGDGQQAQDGLATRALAAAKDERLSHDIKGNTHPRPIADDDTSFSSLLNDMPTDADGPTKHVMWTELVRLKTRTLELKIAEAKQKEKEAELELARLKAGTEHKIELVHAAPVKQVEVSTGFAQTDVGPSKRPIPELATAFANHPLISQAMAPEEVLQQVPHATHNHPSGDEGLSHEASQTPMTQFDLEAMMQNSYMDSLFSWLPEFGETSQVDPYQPTAVAPADLHTSISKTGPLSFQSPYQLPDSQPLVIASHPLPTAKKHRAPSAASSSSSPAPTKKTKRSGEKRVVVEHNSTCLTCRKPIARILIRAPKSRIPDNTSVEFNCGDCQSAARPAIVPDPAAVSSAIGTVDIRKRVRAQAEFEDEDVEADMKRMFCDVCQRVVGYGQVVGGKEKQGMGHMAEIICASCDSKYQR